MLYFIKINNIYIFLNQCTIYDKVLKIIFYEPDVLFDNSITKKMKKNLYNRYLKLLKKRKYLLIYTHSIRSDFLYLLKI